VAGASVEYRGTIAFRQVVIGPPVDVTALALTCWGDSFAIHGIQALPTPPAGRLPPLSSLVATTDTGSLHQGGGGGGHGHPRFLWHVTFEPALPSDIGALTLSDGTAETAVTTRLELAQWPPPRYDATTETSPAAPARAPRRPDEAGEPLPDRVIPLSADLGVVAGVRRALTSLYCWPSWFLMTVEAVGEARQIKPAVIHAQSWEMEDDRGNEYVGAWSGGWSGRDNGVHVAFGPGLDPNARQLRLAFTDPFSQTGRLAAQVTVPSEPYA
jgi:hypothetical protein